MGTARQTAEQLNYYKTLRVTGGGKRDRTADLLHAMQALSQLSYTPTKAADYTGHPILCKGRKIRHYAPEGFALVAQ